MRVGEKITQRMCLRVSGTGGFAVAAPPPEFAQSRPFAGHEDAHVEDPGRQADSEDREESRN